MSKKPLLSESQVAKWMKLANIDQNATQNFLSENKKNSKKLVKENMSYAREDEMGGGEELDLGDAGEMGDGSMGADLSVEEPMEDVGEDMGADEGEVEFDSVEDLKTVIKDAVMDALSELGLADEMGGEEEEETELPDLEDEGDEESEGEGDEGGDEPAGPALQEDIEVLTDDEVINEVLKRVIRRLV
jgi:hypothetical protein